MTSTAPPLVVDLNGTLSHSDNLIEQLITVLLRRPSDLMGVLFALFHGSAALKAHLAALNLINSDALPIRPDVLAYLQSEKAAGRELHLATAADQSMADLVALRIGLFTTAIGSHRNLNLKGRQKLEALAAKFPDGFAYAGNDRADLHVWAGAKTIVLVNLSPSTRRRAMSLGKPVEKEFARQTAGLATWLKAIRIHQWSKNALLFVPLLLAHRYNDYAAIEQISLAFVALGAVASGTYLINDLSDLDADRLHKTKSRRPLASGAISVARGFMAAIFLIAAGLAGAVALSPPFAVCVVAYAGLTLAYSMRIKLIAMLDVFVLGVLYTLRILMGMVLIEAPLSHWLLSFSMFFFFSLSMAKRHVELVRAAEAGNTTGFITGRGYKASDSPLTLSFGVASSLAAILILFLYIVNEAFPVGAYGHPQWLWLIGFLVFLWTTRVWLMSHRGELDDDPVAFALKDPASLFIGLLVLGTFTLAVL